MARPKQLLLPVPNTWGGRRQGAGRKPGPRTVVLHRTRPVHDPKHPAHVTLRIRRGLPNLRLARLFPAVRDALRRASREHFRLVHFSVQRDHLHLLVEADSRERLIRGIQGLEVRVARAVNRVLARRGRVFADRYHARALPTPREVRNALVYVVRNFIKHEPGARGADPCASAADTPLVSARTWLLRLGWRKWGAIAPHDAPRARRA